MACDLPLGGTLYSHDYHSWAEFGDCASCRAEAEADVSDEVGQEPAAEPGSQVRAPKPPMIDRHQALAIQVMHGKLGRLLPEIAHLTFEQAGDLIIELRTEVLARESES